MPSSSARAWKPSLVCDDVGCDAQVTFSLVRADCACHQLSATIATPGTSAVRFVPPSSTKACFTPGSALISSRFALATAAPNTGAFSYTAHSMPGSVKSMLNTGLPVTTFSVSTPFIGLPMMV